MPTLDNLLLFLLADLVLKTSPGPDLALVVSRGLTQGSRAAVASALGVGVAGLVQIPLIVLGLAALFSESPALYQAVKGLGAVYLVYLGIRAIRRCARPVAGAPVQSATRDAFVQGMVTNLLNPKVFVFMIAFLPQFAEPTAGPVWTQLLVFGLIMKANGVLFLSGYGLAASWLRGWAGRSPTLVRLQDGVLGLSMIALGVYLLFDSGPRGAKA